MNFRLSTRPVHFITVSEEWNGQKECEELLYRQL